MNHFINTSRISLQTSSKSHSNSVSPMEFKLLLVYTLLSVALVGSHAVSPQVYWKSLVPNSPMPKSIKDLLYIAQAWDDGEEKNYYTNTESRNIQLKDHPYSYVASEDIEVKDHPVPFFWYGKSKDEVKDHPQSYPSSKNQLKDYPEAKLLFLETDLQQGEELKLHFMKDNQKTAFLPRKIADSIPFTSKDLPEIYNKFSVKPDSVEAKILNQTLNFCELKDIEGEQIYCATSLESMVNFSTAKLGEKVKALSTEVNAKESTSSQTYRTGLVKKLAANKAVVCHKQNYVYAVFYCHTNVGTRSYAVSLVGEDGTKVKSVAVCHTDTSKWRSNHLAFQLLKVTPGTVPVCHFLPEDLVLWVPY